MPSQAAATASPEGIERTTVYGRQRRRTPEERSTKNCFRAIFPLRRLLAPVTVLRIGRPLRRRCRNAPAAGFLNRSRGRSDRISHLARARTSTGQSRSRYRHRHRHPFGDDAATHLLPDFSIAAATVQTGYRIRQESGPPPANREAVSAHTSGASSRRADAARHGRIVRPFCIRRPMQAYRGHRGAYRRGAGPPRRQCGSCEKCRPTFHERPETRTTCTPPHSIRGSGRLRRKMLLNFPFVRCRHSNARRQTTPLNCTPSASARNISA